MLGASYGLDTASVPALGYRPYGGHAAAVRLYVLVLALGCGAAQHPARATQGKLAGMARDRDSGDPVAHADLHLRAEGSLAPHALTTDKNGGYAFDHLAPGRYSLEAEFAGQPIDVEHIDVRAGETTLVDVVFTLGQPDRLYVEFGDPKDGAISRYHSRHLAPQVAIIEGTVTDAATRTPVAGASVTATGGDGTQLAVTDALGRYRFDRVAPGAYTVSAYYSIGGRGQIEIRRSDIAVDGGDDVIVPLWVETNGR